MKEFSRSWKSSKRPGKQRKYAAKAPMHVRQKLLGASLTKPLRTSTGVRSLPVRTGDKVKVMRGDYKGKEGKVERVNLKSRRLYVTGIDRKKRDGSSSLYPFHPSNIQITELKTGDKKRIKKSTKKTAEEKK